MSCYEFYFKIKDEDMYLVRYNISGKSIPPIDKLYYAKSGIANDEGFKSLVELKILE